MAFCWAAGSLLSPDLEPMPQLAVARCARLAAALLRSRQVACIDTYTRVGVRGLLVACGPVQACKSA